MPTETIINRGARDEERVTSERNEDSLATRPPSLVTDEILAENGFYWREESGVKVLVCRALEEKGFVNGFSTRLGGTSSFPENALNLSGLDIDAAENVSENRRRFLQLFDGDFQIATVWQIHSDKIKVIKSADDARDTDEKFDALVADISDLLVGVKTADCVPVSIGDERTKAFAAVHAGWRGTVQSIVPKTIDRMRENFGTRAEDLTVAIGAAALNCCYEIGRDVMDAFAQNFPNSENLFTPTVENHARVDLHTANRLQLLDSGVAPENIFAAPLCTIDRTDLFFSYRVESKKFGKTGRLLSVIGRKSTDSE